MVGTSLTDTDSWREACSLASREDSAYVNFRREADMVLGVSAEQGEQYRSLTPPEHRYGGDDPVMDRYAHTIYRLVSIFGCLDGLSILEIGGGFGGLARLIEERYVTASYMIVDLPEVLGLQRRYLSEHGVPAVRFLPSPHASARVACDLLISNYAYSELRADVQRIYADRYLSCAEHGYMVCNFITPNSLPASELRALVPRARWEPEIPLTHPLNAVLVW